MGRSSDEQIKAVRDEQDTQIPYWLRGNREQVLLTARPYPGVPMDQINLHRPLWPHDVVWHGEYPFKSENMQAVYDTELTVMFSKGWL